MGNGSDSGVMDRLVPADVAIMVQICSWRMKNLTELTTCALLHLPQRCLGLGRRQQFRRVGAVSRRSRWCGVGFGVSRFRA